LHKGARKGERVELTSRTWSWSEEADGEKVKTRRIPASVQLFLPAARTINHEASRGEVEGIRRYEEHEESMVPGQSQLYDFSTCSFFSGRLSECFDEGGCGMIKALNQNDVSWLMLGQTMGRQRAEESNISSNNVLVKGWLRPRCFVEEMGGG
jgi:hypothetical protein